jgi:hypothetical protein
MKGFPKTRKYAKELSEEIGELNGAAPEVVEEKIKELNLPTLRDRIVTTTTPRMTTGYTFNSEFQAANQSVFFQSIYSVL